MHLRIIDDNHIDVKECTRCNGTHFAKEVNKITEDSYIVKPKDEFGGEANYTFYCENGKENIFLYLNDGTEEDHEPEVSLEDLLNKFSRTREQTLYVWIVSERGLTRKGITQSSDGKSKWRIDEHGRFLDEIGSLYEFDKMFLKFEDAVETSKQLYPELYESQTIVIPTEINL